MSASASACALHERACRPVLRQASEGPTNRALCMPLTSTQHAHPTRGADLVHAAFLGLLLQLLQLLGANPPLGSDELLLQLAVPFYVCGMAKTGPSVEI